ncbi:MAG TPA: hypothetical protein VIL13_00010 [Longimicrobiales bacterium]|jgi:hypothetical protein
MSNARIPTAVLSALVGLLGLLGLLAASPARAQVCLGLPARDGQISLLGEIASSPTGPTSYGGRLGVNFNTEYSLDLALRRPYYDEGIGLVVSGGIAYEMERYRPPVCFIMGLRHERMPTAEGDDLSATHVSLGFGIGKRLGSARGLSTTLFLRPEYLVRIRPNPTGEYETFWDELGARSGGRGVIGLLLATPFLFGSGSIEVDTRNDYEPTIALGVGLTF